MLDKTKLKHLAHKTGHIAKHTGHDGAHVVYFAAAFLEGHGLYSLMGGCLCAMGTYSLVMFLIGAWQSDV